MANEMPLQPKTQHNVDSSDEEDGKFGCGPCQTECLNNIKAHVMFQCVFNFFEGFIVNGVINVIIVALETRYSLNSSKSGLISSANDFGLFLVLLPISYFGEHRHKPRIMGFGILIMALGSLVFALPQFIGGNYEYTISGGSGIGDTSNGTSNLCTLNSTDVGACPVNGGQSHSSNLYAMFLIGQILLGIGACPMFTIGLSYIDENTHTEMTSLYTGYTFCAAAVGVAIGYVVGGQTLQMFVDINTVDLDSIRLTPADPQWVGAWWTGILVAFGAFCFIAIPFFGYPRRLPGFKELNMTRKSEAHVTKADEVAARPGFGKNIKDFPKSVFCLMRNPTYVLLTLAATVEALIVGGMATFGAKLLQQRFHADITTAGLVMGIVTVPGAGGGMILGGYLVKRMNLKCRGILRFCALLAAISLLFTPSFLARCDDTPLAGVTSSYLSHSSNYDLKSDCNSGCGCSTVSYEPLCLNSSLVYFSPCHAGCTRLEYINNTKHYDNCKCLEQRFENLTKEQVTSRVEPGACNETCPWLYVFSVMFFLIMVFTFASMAPTVSALFRCVPHPQRSLALGLNLLIVRLLGTTPGPVLLGAIFDSTCLVWQETCQGQGSCWVYEKNNMAYRLIAWWAGLKLLSATFYSLASKVYKAPTEKSS